MRLKWILVVLAAGCGTNNDAADHGSCDDLIACSSVVTPEATGGLVASYGSSSACWKDARDAASCRQACALSLADLQGAYPSSCGGTVGPIPLPDMASSTPAVNYPAGPYGFAQGSVISNLQFQALVDPGGPSGTANYITLPLVMLSLADYYNDSQTHWLVLSAVAGWCTPCQQQAKTITTSSRNWEAKGVRFLTVLLEGYNESTPKAAAMGDLSKWQQQSGEHIAIGLDSQGGLAEFSAESFPVNMLIRTADMKIVYSAIGVDPNNASLDPVLQQYAN